MSDLNDPVRALLDRVQQDTGGGVPQGPATPPALDPPEGFTSDPILETIAATFLKAGAPKVPSSSQNVGVPGQLPALEVSPRATAQAYPGGQSAELSGLKAFVEGVRTCGHTPPSRPGVPADPFSRQFHSTLKDPSRLTASPPFSADGIRSQFPILRQKVNGHPLAWFDNAATTQKPQSVIDSIRRFYETDNSNIHRGAHTLAARATDAYEKARDKVRDYIGARFSSEIVLVRGTTEGVNLVANTWGRANLGRGDEILLTVLEHHANIVPWQLIAKERGAILRVTPVNERGEILLDEYERLLTPRTKLVAFAHANNTLGTILPVAEMAWLAKKSGATVLVDGAQSVAHLPVDVHQWGIDFFVFSGHKVFAPTGIGAVWGREEVWKDLPPWQGGGNMIHNVTFDETTFNPPPARFEAGTPNVADAVGLGAALDWVNSVGLERIAAHEHELLEYATALVSKLDKFRIIGNAREKVGVLSFVHATRSVTEVGKHLDQHGIAVRSGHHCAQPSLRRFGVEATVRPSFSVYNTKDEIDRMVRALRDL
jgi:cysteine desulfurase/selenocysteine lyase